MHPPKGTFELHEPFIITGRGLVFTGILLSGEVNSGDVLAFSFQGRTIQRQIKGVNTGMRGVGGKPNMGLLIKCRDKAERDMLRAWDPANSIATIYG